MFTVYAISSVERKYIYVGMTSNLEERLYRHNSGYERTTKPYKPFRLIYTQEFETRLEAREREKFLKTTTGKRFLRSLEESCDH
jgi:putative endonuclease